MRCFFAKHRSIDCLCLVTQGLRREHVISNDDDDDDDDDDENDTIS